MADEQSTKPKRTRRRPLSKRQLSAKVSFSNLWIPDRQLLLEIAAKRHVSEAELIREIVHQWAIKKRLAPDTEDGAEEMARADVETRHIFRVCAVRVSCVKKSRRVNF